MFFTRWPVFRTFIFLSIAGIAYQTLPSRLDNEKMVEDFIEIGSYLVKGENLKAYAAIQRGYAPFLDPIPDQQQYAQGQYRQPQAQSMQTSSRMGREVRVRGDARSHFHVNPVVNGQRANFMIDTGASIVAIRYEDALRLGFRVAPADFTIPVSTANGTTYFAPVMIDRIELEGITVRNVRGAIGPQGAMGQNLLGMSFLRELSDVRFNGNEILLVE